MSSISCPYCHDGKSGRKRGFILKHVFYCQNCGKNVPLHVYYNDTNSFGNFNYDPNKPINIQTNYNVTEFIGSFGS